MDRFGIAPAVATRDLTAYRELASKNIDFDGRKKIYVPTMEFSHIFAHEPDRVLSALSRSFGEGIGKALSGFLPCEFPLRLNQPPLSVLATITRAIHQNRTVRLVYHSLNTGPSERDVVPVALVDNGLRWHARVFDRKSGAFRDMVITRMENPWLLEADANFPYKQIAQDVQWTKFVTLELVTHPSQERPEIVERDFGIDN